MKKIIILLFKYNNKYNNYKYNIYYKKNKIYITVIGTIQENQFYIMPRLKYVHILFKVICCN